MSRIRTEKFISLSSKSNFINNVLAPNDMTKLMNASHETKSVLNGNPDELNRVLPIANDKVRAILDSSLPTGQATGQTGDVPCSYR